MSSKQGAVLSGICLRLRWTTVGSGYRMMRIGFWIIKKPLTGASGHNILGQFIRYSWKVKEDHFRVFSRTYFCS